MNVIDEKGVIQKVQYDGKKENVDRSRFIEWLNTYNSKNDLHEKLELVVNEDVPNMAESPQI